MNKPIEEISVFNPKITRIFYSIQSAAKELNITPNQLIRIIQRQEVFNRHLYKFYYKEDSIIVEDFFPIQQYDPETQEVINQFKTITEAARDLEYSRNNISKCIHTGEPDRYGYCWRKLNK